MKRKNFLKIGIGLIGTSLVGFGIYEIINPNVQPPKYYQSDNEYDCVRSALANILLQFGDRRNAERVFNKYKEHPFVLENGGISSGLITRLLTDITDSKYTGTLYGNIAPNLEEITQRSYVEKAEEVLRIINEEQRKGRIRDLKGEYIPRIPSLFLVRVYGLEDQNQVSQHAMVYLGNNLFIDNGIVREYPLDKMKISAVLEVEEAK